jgi:hypothetical protein
VRCSYSCITVQQRFSSTLLSNLKNHSDCVIQTGTGSELLQNSARSQYQTVRSFKQHFKPSVWKRAHKHGLERTLVKTGLKEAMWRKYLKGKPNLLIVDRFMNYPPKSKKEQKQLPIIHKELHKFYPHQRQVPTWKKP